ncbi:MAG: Hsp20 family protein [Rhodospirillaceae bacterium]
MRTFDLSPLYRSTVGFDHLTRILDGLQVSDSGQTYPPYNIEKLGEDAYRIAIAVAGFSADDIEIVSAEGQLSVKGKAKTDDEKSTYLYRGIAARAFERRFQLADYVLVTGARLENGLLQIDLARQVPEALKPRSIPINTGSDGATVTHLNKKAA